MIPASYQSFIKTYRPTRNPGGTAIVELLGSRFAVDLLFELSQRFHKFVEFRRLTEYHDAHIPVVPLQCRHAGLRRHETEISGLRQIVTSPSGRIERFLMPHDLGEKRHVRKSLSPDRAFRQHGNVVVVTGVSLR